MPRLEKLSSAHSARHDQNGQMSVCMYVNLAIKKGVGKKSLLPWGLPGLPPSGGREDGDFFFFFFASNQALPPPPPPPPPLDPLKNSPIRDTPLAPA